MARAGTLEALLGPLPVAVKKVMVDYTNAWVKRFAFGAPSSVAVSAENFGGHLVPYTTSSTANREVAVEHKLSRIPRLAMQCFALDTVNATSPVLTISRAADATYLYIKSATTSASGHLYVE